MGTPLRTKAPTQRYLIVILCAISCWGAFAAAASAQSTTDVQPASGWAIAVHGGAGGNPNEWTEAQRQARLAGIREVLTVGQTMLSEGKPAVDAVEAVIRRLEDNPAFNAGRGAVLTSAKRAELDATIMDGQTLACGAVGGVTIVKHPITLARRVMSETRHVLLAGPGADQFARDQSVETVPPSYFILSPDEKSQSAAHHPAVDYLGTVGCVVLDAAGNLAAGTSTGGLAGKMPGRLGDSPIIGAGTYAKNGTCAVSATGTGEEYIRNAIAYDISAQMQYLGVNVEEAVRHVMKKTLKPGTGGLIAVGQDGTITLQHNTPGMTCGAADHSGRFEIVLEVADQ